MEKMKNVPIALLQGLNDKLADPVDVAYAKKFMKNTDVFFDKMYKDMDHYSFQVGKDMSYVDDIIPILKDKAISKSSFETV